MKHNESPKNSRGLADGLPVGLRKWRDQGKLDYFQPDWSSRVLYPVESVEAFEARYTKRVEIEEPKRITEIKRETPGMSSRPSKEWGI
ncbi:MAG: hypothetical protein ACQET7_10985 [Thermodesulfobacteriota bacterium]